MDSYIRVTILHEPHISHCNPVRQHPRLNTNSTALRIWTFVQHRAIPWTQKWCKKARHVFGLEPEQMLHFKQGQRSILLQRTHTHTWTQNGRSVYKRNWFSLCRDVNMQKLRYVTILVYIKINIYVYIYIHIEKLYLFHACKFVCEHVYIYIHMHMSARTWETIFVYISVKSVKVPFSRQHAKLAMSFLFPTYFRTKCFINRRNEVK